MAIIDSSVSPLARLTANDVSEVFDPLEEQDEELEDLPERTPKPAPPAGSLLEALVNQIEDINLARYIADDALDQIGMECVREYEIDANSRAGWADKARKAMRFCTQDTLPKQYPWPGASSTIYPLITQACLDFHARITAAVLPGQSIVRGMIWGDDNGTPITQNGQPGGPPKTAPDGSPIWLVKPGEKRARADRVGEHMSWQLLTENPEWAPQTDQLLLQMPAIGGGARKTFRDPVLMRNRSLYVSLMNLVWNYHAPSFEAAPRHTEKLLLYPGEITELERAGDDGDGGMFLEIDYASAEGGTGDSFNFDEEVTSADQSDDSAPRMFIEQHRLLDLDDDGYPEPYIVTIHRQSAKVVRIVARYRADDIEASDDGDTILRIKPVCHYTLYPFLPSIDGGSYPMGFGHLLRTINEAINTSYNQLFDAGHLANAGGGFMSDQISVPSGQTLFQVGRYTRVTTKGSSIRDAVLPLPFPGPNMALFQVMGALVAAGKDIAGIGSVLTGDAAIANAPPTTILALIEQGLRGYTGIAQRVFRAEKEELAKLFELNRIYVDKPQRYQMGDDWREIHPDDYKANGGVEPVTDPKMATDMQKLARAQLLMDFKGDPLINQREIRTRLFQAAGLDHIDQLMAPPDPNAAQMAQVAAQMAIAMQQAELGKLRAQELKDQTQAFLNMALARKNATAGEEAQIDAQLEFMRMTIEALNTTVKAAAVDAKVHSTNMSATMERARMLAEQGPPVAAGLPTPAPAAPFPQATGEPPPGPDIVNAGSKGTGSPPADITPPAGATGPTGPGNPAAAPAAEGP